MTYSIFKSPFGDGIRLDKGNVRLLIPQDPENTDYQRYLAWLADGNEPEVIEG